VRVCVCVCVCYVQSSMTGSISLVSEGQSPAATTQHYLKINFLKFPFDHLRVLRADAEGE